MEVNGRTCPIMYEGVPSLCSNCGIITCGGCRRFPATQPQQTTPQGPKRQMQENGTTMDKEEGWQQVASKRKTQTTKGQAQNVPGKGKGVAERMPSKEQIQISSRYDSLPMEDTEEVNMSTAATVTQVPVGQVGTSTQPVKKKGVSANKGKENNPPSQSRHEERQGAHISLPLNDMSNKPLALSLPKPKGKTPAMSMLKRKSGEIKEKKEKDKQGKTQDEREAHSIQPSSTFKEGEGGRLDRNMFVFGGETRPPDIQEDTNMGIKQQGFEEEDKELNWEEHRSTSVRVTDVEALD